MVSNERAPPLLQVNAAKLLGVQRHVFIAQQETSSMMPEVSAALPGTDSGAAAGSPAADPPSPYSTRPHAVAPAEACAVAEAVIAATHPATAPGSRVLLLPPGSGTMNLSSQMNLSTGTNISVPSGWPAAQEGLEQLDSCTSALLRAGVLPAEANSMVRSTTHVRPMLFGNESTAPCATYTPAGPPSL